MQGLWLNASHTDFARIEKIDDYYGISGSVAMEFDPEDQKRIFPRISLQEFEPDFPQLVIDDFGRYYFYSLENVMNENRGRYEAEYIEVAHVFAEQTALTLDDRATIHSNMVAVIKGLPTSGTSYTWHMLQSSQGAGIHDFELRYVRRPSHAGGPDTMIELWLYFSYVQRPAVVFSELQEADAVFMVKRLSSNTYEFELDADALPSGFGLRSLFHFGTKVLRISRIEKNTEKETVKVTCI